MVTQVLARMAFRVPKEAEASLLLSPELTVLVIRQGVGGAAGAGGASGAPGIGCVGASCSGGAGGAGGSNFGSAGSAPGGSACQSNNGGTSACITGNGGMLQEDWLVLEDLAEQASVVLVGRVDWQLQALTVLVDKGQRV